MPNYDVHAKQRFAIPNYRIPWIWHRNACLATL